MTIFVIALLIGVIVGVLSGNVKFLEPYMIGWAAMYVLVKVVRWLI